MATAKRGIKRRKDDYTNEQFGRGDSNMPQDDYTINDKLCRVNLVRPSAEGLLVFRPWNQLDYNDPENNLLPGRVSTHDRGQGLWMRRMRCASFVGIDSKFGGRKITFLICRHGDKTAQSSTPYPVLYNAAKRAHTENKFACGRAWDGDWNKLLEGGKNRGADLPAPTCKWFTQAEVYRNGDKDYLDERTSPLGADPGDDLTMVQLPSGAGESIMSVLALRKEQVPEGIDLEKRPAAAFVYGDPCGFFNAKTRTVKGGLFFTLWNPKRNRAWVPPDDNHSWDGKISDMQGYEVWVSKTYKYNGMEIRPDLDTARVEEIFRKWQFWLPDADDTTKDDGILCVLPVEQQALLLAQAFKPVPNLLRFAWAEHEDDFLTADVQAVLNSRSQVTRPGLAGEDMPEDGVDEDKVAAGKSATKTDKLAERRKVKTAAQNPPFEDDEFADDADDDKTADVESDEQETEDVDEFDDETDAVDEAPADETDEEDDEEDDNIMDEFADVSDNLEEDEDEGDAEAETDEAETDEADEEPEQVVCAACKGKGKSTKGKKCIPCDGTGLIDKPDASESDDDNYGFDNANAESFEEDGEPEADFDPEEVVDKTKKAMQASLAAATGRASKPKKAPAAPPAKGSGKKGKKK